MTERHLIKLARQCADIARSILVDNFKKNIPIHYKKDASPVTACDKNIEKELRALINEQAPFCGIIGEEYPSHNEDAEWLFTIDPLDGTLNFINGKPLFGTLIAIIHDGTPLYGILDHPILNERWEGGTHHSCRLNGRACHVNETHELKHAHLNASSPHMFLEGAQSHAFHNLRKHSHAVLYGADCYAYGLLASGLTDLIAEATMKIPDFAALAPVVTSAGGVISDWKGDNLSIHSDGTVLAAATQELHAQALTCLNS